MADSRWMDSLRIGKRGSELPSQPETQQRCLASLFLTFQTDPPGPTRHGSEFPRDSLSGRLGELDSQLSIGCASHAFSNCARGLSQTRTGEWSYPTAFSKNLGQDRRILVAAL